jgi:hypothetical protein
LTSIIFGIYFIVSNVSKFNKISTEKIYTVLILIGTTAHMLLNKTNAFYAVNFWYFVYVFIFFKEVSEYKIFKFLKNKMYFIITIILIGIFINIIVLSKTLNHGGPNLNLKFDHYSYSYRKKLISEFEKCCGEEPKNHFAIDDAAYFILKNKIQTPVPVTYASVFGNQSDIYRDKHIRYIIAKCDYIKSNYNLNELIEVEGAKIGKNICIKKLY